MTSPPTGSKLESAWMILLMVRDTLLLPLHLLAFTLLRPLHRRRLRSAMAAASKETGL